MQKLIKSQEIKFTFSQRKFSLQLTTFERLESLGSLVHCTSSMLRPRLWPGHVFNLCGCEYRKNHTY